MIEESVFGNNEERRQILKEGTRIESKGKGRSLRRHREGAEMTRFERPEN